MTFLENEQREESPATMLLVQVPIAVCEYNGKRQIEGMDGVYTARRVGVSVMETAFRSLYQHGNRLWTSIFDS